MDPNTLYYGDNLDVLRRHVPDATVDLVYLDPPFKSNQDYNVLFAEHTGERSASQIRAFEDTWRWSLEAEGAYRDVVEHGGKVADAMRAMRIFLGESDMLAYLAMMAPRLLELRRVLKPTGSIYLHCDPTASHYLKMLMDGVFGPENYRNELIWRRHHSGHGDAKGRFGRVHDTILFYARSKASPFYPPYRPYTPDEIVEKFPNVDPDGRRWYSQTATSPNPDRPNLTYEWNGHTRAWKYLPDVMRRLHDAGELHYSKTGFPRRKQYADRAQGEVPQDVWSDVMSLTTNTAERLGYPTQKPEALLERIIRASSKERDVVLDPFCGCGTAVAVAQRLNRFWIGIDVTHLAITLIKHRLESAFGGKAAYRVVGEPVSVPDAAALAESDPYQFQWWALGLVGARPAEQKKGADKGVDGRLYFHDEGSGGATKQIIFSVKAGHVTAAHVRDLRGVVERERAAIGVLICMEAPTQPMRAEAATAGFYRAPIGGEDYPRLQLLTVADLLGGKRVEFPRFAHDRTFKAAPRSRTQAAEPQGDLGFATGPVDTPKEVPAKPGKGGERRRGRKG